jgi:hypothetical protein
MKTDTVLERDARMSRDLVFVEGLVDLLVLCEPVIRVDLVEAAKARIADGDHPSAEVLARHLL